VDEVFARHWHEGTHLARQGTQQLNGSCPAPGGAHEGPPAGLGCALLQQDRFFVSFQSMWRWMQLVRECVDDKGKLGKGMRTCWETPVGAGPWCEAAVGSALQLRQQHSALALEVQASTACCRSASCSGTPCSSCSATSGANHAGGLWTLQMHVTEATTRS
jgi:hypothetical protein